MSNICLYLLHTYEIWNTFSLHLYNLKYQNILVLVWIITSVIFNCRMLAHANSRSHLRSLLIHFYLYIASGLHSCGQPHKAVAIVAFVINSFNFFLAKSQLCCFEVVLIWREAPLWPWKLNESVFMKNVDIIHWISDLCAFIFFCSWINSLCFWSPAGLQMLRFEPLHSYVFFYSFPKLISRSSSHFMGSFYLPIKDCHLWMVSMENIVAKFDSNSLFLIKKKCSFRSITTRSNFRALK